jgi:site-specific DNA recombinase
MANDLVKRAQYRDLTGMNFAGLVRLSLELDSEEEGAAVGSGVASGAKAAPRTARDINNRETQEEDCRELIESFGGTYVYTYPEPDTSAWKRRRVRLPDGTVGYRVIRPVYKGALDDLRRHRAPNGERLDGMVVYDTDRLTRDNRDLEDAIDVVVQHQRPILDCSGTLDLLTDNGRTVARIVVATKSGQSADTARRVSRKHRRTQQEGIPTSPRRPFGWRVRFFLSELVGGQAARSSWSW